MKLLISFSIILLLLLSVAPTKEETLPPLQKDFVPTTVDEVWQGFDPRKEPLEVEVIKEWEADNTVIKIIRYHIGVFKGKKATMAAVYGYPKGAEKLPAIIQIHGGGQSAQDTFVMANAKNGYATLSIAWSGRIKSAHYNVTNTEKEMFWTGETTHPDYRITTDWGAVDAYHHHARFKGNNFVQNPPSASTVDSVKSPRNSGWFLTTLANRRGITFLEQQPEVDADRIGVYGMSMGGKLTVLLAGSDDRVKVAVPACGGISNYADNRTLAPVADENYLKRISCPIAFMSPANDFHGKVEHLPEAVARIQSKQWRIVSSPNVNHSDSPEYAATGMLWFDQVLKGSFNLPNTPAGKLHLNTDNHTAKYVVTPDASKTIHNVDIYYTTDATRKPADRLWRKAEATEQQGTWSALLPLFDTNRALWVYADTTYALDQPITGVGYSGKRFGSNRFHLASVVQMASTDQLKQAGIKASLTRPEILETFNNGWQGWTKEGDFHRFRKRLFSARENEAPTPEAKLALEVRSEKPNKLIISLDSYGTEIDINGGSQWQQISLSASDFDNGDGATLANWEAISDIVIGEFKRYGKKRILKGAPWQGRKAELRNLRWITSPQ